MDNINTNNLDLSGPVCRACLKFGAKNKIFSIHKSTSLTYSYIFSTCFSVKVEFDDGLPKFICRKCLTKLVSFYKYRNVVAANDSKLRQILATNRKESIEDPNKCEKEVKFEFTNSDISKDNGHTSNKDFEIVEPNIKTEIKNEETEYNDNNRSRIILNDDTNDNFGSFITDLPKDEIQEQRIRNRRCQCDICGKILSCKSSLNQHVRTHTGERRYSCEICGKHFLKSEHVVIHKRIHTGERPFACTICKKRFIQSAVLKIHLRTHSGEKPHMCSVCGKSFGQSSSLVYHLRTHSGETPFSCKTCGKGFRNAGNLSIHKRFHDNERPFSCKICEKRFVTSSHLNVHIKQHNGDKSHRCIVCGKGFVRGEHLKIHMVVHTGQKPYICKLCPKKYTQLSHLNRHMKTHKPIVNVIK